MEQTQVMCNQEELVQPPCLHVWDAVGDKNGNHRAWSNRLTLEPSRGSESVKESDMDIIRWVGVSGFLLSALLCDRTQGCFSDKNCCHDTEITPLQDLKPNPSSCAWETHKQQDEPAQGMQMPSSSSCQAVSEGDQNNRSTSPWNYELDFNQTRYPQRLWQARCSCLHSCVSLASCNEMSGNQNLFSQQERNGNSVEVKHNILVFYRESCPRKPGHFYLKPHWYPVSVACTCVAARRRGMCHAKKGGR